MSSQPSGRPRSRSLSSLRNGKLLAPCSDSVKTVGSSRKIDAVPCLVHVEVDDDDAPAAGGGSGAISPASAAPRPRRREDAVADPCGRTHGGCRRRGWRRPRRRQNAVRAAAIVAPTECRVRSTMVRTTGSRSRAAGRPRGLPSATAAIHAGSCAAPIRRRSPALQPPGRQMPASDRLRASKRYLDIGSCARPAAAGRTGRNEPFTAADLGTGA